MPGRPRRRKPRRKAEPVAPPARRRAVIYARVSSKDQEREGFSIPAQQRLLRQYAEQQGFTVVEEFTDVRTPDMGAAPPDVLRAAAPRLRDDECLVSTAVEAILVTGEGDRVRASGSMKRELPWGSPSSVSGVLASDLPVGGGTLCAWVW